MSHLEEQSALASARHKGTEEGLKQGKIQIAKKLLYSNMSINEIILITELTKEEIEKIKNTK